VPIFCYLEMNLVHARMQEIARTSATQKGMHLLEVTVHPQTHQVLVDLVIDTEAGINLDECAAVSRRVSDALELEFPDVPFALHVGSPGTERALEFDWQFQRNVGRRLRLTVEDPDATRTLEIRLVAFDAEALHGEKGAGTMAIERARIRRAVVLPEFTKKK
jgi:ribosome maturation factor RimP